METHQFGLGAGQYDPNDAQTHYQGREITLYGSQGPTFDGTTTHKANFVAHPLEPRQPISPTGQYHNPAARFEGNTSYHQDYPAHPVEPRHALASAQYQPNPAPFDGQTTHKGAFVAHPMEPRPHAGPNHQTRPSAPFEGSSSYKQDYGAHPMERRTPHQQAQYVPNPAPFDGTSSYNSAYTQHAMEPRTHGGPRAGSISHNSAPFEGQTHYKDDFRAHTIEPRPPPPANQYSPNPAPFDGSTETRDQFQAWPLEPRPSHGPPPMRAHVPFEGSTTHKDAFRGWKLPDRRPALGVQMVGDRTYVLIPAEAALPAIGKQVFTTVHDNQGDMSILVLKGNAPVASRNNVVGQFDLRGLPVGPKGAARMEVTFHLDAHNVLTATAMDLDASRQEAWLHQGSMAARALGSDVQVM